jgi:hypothetical protein
VFLTLRTRSPAIVIAIAAVVIAAGGVAIGAIPARDGKITACYSKRDGALRVIDAGDKCRKREKRIAWNQRGRRGPAGEDGLDGLDGSDGFDGFDGEPAASMLVGSVDTTVTGSGEAFAFPSGRDASTGTPESEHVMLSPAAETVARDLAVKLDPAAPDPGDANFTFIIRANGDDTPVSCSITGAQRSCDSGSATAMLPAGSELTLKHTQTGTADGAAREFRFGWRATTP